MKCFKLTIMEHCAMGCCHLRSSCVLLRLVQVHLAKHAENFLSADHRYYHGLLTKVNTKSAVAVATRLKINVFRWLHNEKRPAAGEKFGNPFFCAPEARQKFSEDFFIFVRGPP